MTDAVDAAHAYLAAFATGDPDRVAGRVHPDFHNEHTSALASSCHGRDEYRRRLPGFLATFSGLEYHVEDTVADGDKVVLAYRMTASWRSDEGVEHPLSIRGVVRLRIVNGLVAHRVDYWDGSEFLRQTGQA